MLKYFVALQSFAMNTYEDLTAREEGQTMAEYGVVLAVITLLVVGAFLALGGKISATVSQVTSFLP